MAHPISPMHYLQAFAGFAAAAAGTAARPLGEGVGPEVALPPAPSPQALPAAPAAAARAETVPGTGGRDPAFLMDATDEKPRNVFSLFGRKVMKEDMALSRAPSFSHRQQALRFCDENDYKQARVFFSYFKGYMQELLN